MGTYCTTTSLEIFWDGTSFTDLTAMASELIDQSEAEINKRLSDRYDMSAAVFQTSTSIPPAIQNIAKWLSLGYLYEANARGSKDTFVRADRYIKKANKNIDDILAYKANLVGADGSLVADNADEIQIISSTEDYSPTFNEDDPLNWDVDSTKISDITSERS